MHIPDGFLDPVMIGVTYLAGIGYIAYAFYKARNSASDSELALVPVLAAVIFAAQMLNWPIPGGTSLHFVGGALAGILLGPYLGSLTMFLVLLVQCLVFHDGGVTALGANVLNMAVVDVLLGYALYRFVAKLGGGSPRVRFLGAFLGGWLGITAAGIICGFEIGFSPAFPYGVAISVPVMAVWHAALGIVEGVATGLAINYLYPRITTPYMRVEPRGGTL